MKAVVFFDGRMQEDDVHFFLRAADLVLKRPPSVNGYFHRLVRRCIFHLLHHRVPRALMMFLQRHVVEVGLVLGQDNHELLPRSVAHLKFGGVIQVFHLAPIFRHGETRVSISGNNFLPIRRDVFDSGACFVPGLD
jgi:hypothetical protein